MTDAQGIVTSVGEDGKAEVLIQASELCIHCASEVEVCNCSADSSRITVKAINPVGASVGDLVSISHKPGAVLKNITIFLVIPAIGLVLGLVTGASLNQRYVIGGAHIGLIAGVGLLLGILCSFLVYKRLSADIQPIISHVLKRRP